MITSRNGERKAGLARDRLRRALCVLRVVLEYQPVAGGVDPRLDYPATLYIHLSLTKIRPFAGASLPSVGLPVFPRQSSPILSGVAMERKRIHDALRDEFEAAKRRMNVASMKFNEVVRDIPSGLPHPDGTQRIQNAGHELIDAREKLAAAIARLNDFVSHDVVPEDLRDSK